jgi:hypothetical protein
MPGRSTALRALPDLLESRSLFIASTRRPARDCRREGVDRGIHGPPGWPAAAPARRSAPRSPSLLAVARRQRTPTNTDNHVSEQGPPRGLLGARPSRGRQRGSRRDARCRRGWIAYPARRSDVDRDRNRHALDGQISKRRPRNVRSVDARVSSPTSLRTVDDGKPPRTRGTA